MPRLLQSAGKGKSYMASLPARTAERSTQTSADHGQIRRGMIVTIQVTITVVVPFITRPIRLTIVSRRWVPFVGTIYEASGLVQAADGTLILARVPIR